MADSVRAGAPAGADRPGLFTPLFTDIRVAAVLGLGFAQGMPFLLVYATQSAWLSEAKVPLATIGLMSELTIAYKFKFLWAPFLDRYDPPLLGRLIGRRRGWIVAAQIAVAAALAGVAFGDPAHWLAWTVAFSLALGVAGATQDIVVDGWRIAVAPVERQALMSSWAEIGYRCGNLAAGAGALYLADAYGWRAAYLCMAALMAPGTVAALMAPEPSTEGQPSRAGLVETIWAPIRDLIGRLGPLAVPVLLLVAGFRMPGYVSSAMAIPLFKHLGYSNTDIATVTKLFGFWIALGGTFLASAIIPRIGMMASLLFGTVAASASHLSLAYLAWHGGHGGAAFWTFAMSVGIDGFAYAFASIVLITYMSRLADSQHAASQYALLTSLCALPGSLLAGLSGFVIEATGFPLFFVGTSLIGLPVAALCLYVAHRHGPMEG
ncbi:AmpG family muropeptide MFS transporter [Methylobacterium persicinum]|uniref:PAT family beta-lactamase induction signal transducer AmpG n=1 Tax=Methylobacterium persicinum TaxID=374426 RepID=A0ABU0HLL9_9HYPH|nr:MFS transporter [Methylobacterium persicinum]MDQ0443214.1 PAT family beta-lactamase induction signal transducer AmpG [Methylobacterium persicinum]GJE38210.1 Anhydromuropeptide permease [Methylobacterium persicinum]